MTESFFIYKLEYLFIFSDTSFKIPEPNPLYNKKKPCLKYHLIFFFRNLIIDFFVVWKVLYERSCSTKGAAQLLTLTYKNQSKTLLQWNLGRLKGKAIH